MRFDFKAYNKVFPETEAVPQEPIESAVDTFTPTESEAKAMDKKPGAEVMETIPEEPIKEAEPIAAPEGEKDE